MNKKLAVVFPGMGYHCDKPLLYYARKAAKSLDYDVLGLRYELSRAAADLKNDQEKMRGAFDEALKQSMEQISNIDFSKYEKVVFIGKSIGTVVAAYINETEKLNAGQVIFTPVPKTFDFVGRGKSIVFHGTSDPWCDSSIAESRCRELGLELQKYENANHSLETGNVVDDVQIVQDVMVKVESFLRR